MRRTSMYVMVAFVLAASEIYMSLSSLNGLTSDRDREGDLDHLHLTAMNAGATSANKVHFRDFTANPKHHNSTVTGEVIPGPFFDDQLFFLGARLTTSFIPNNTQVHVDVFGFPGDRLIVKPDSNLFCDPTNVSQAWRIRSHAILYCQLECKRGDSKEPNDCGEPIRMTWIKSISGDNNQNGLALIWRCDVSKYLTKTDLHHQAAAAAGGELSSVRVRLFLKRPRHDTGPPLIDLTQFDIPLHTAVIGYGGPTIRHDKLGYFALQQQQQQQQQQQTASMNVGLCLTAYGFDSQRYLLEFVHHHLNVGISHIVLGIITNMDSEEINLAEQLLRPFIDNGFVSMQAIGLDDYMTCFTDVPRVNFFHQCLYHFKGLYEYAATWDLDEYWIPPTRLEVSGTSTFSHDHFGVEIDDANTVDTILGTHNNTAEARMHQRFIESSHSSAFSPLATRDPLWQESNYSKSISILDVVKAVEQYHAMNHDCGGKWCYVVFPSISVYRKKNVERTHRIADDFNVRDAFHTVYWKKSIARTQIAMTGGIHLPGSCQYPNDLDVYSFGKDEQCYPHVWEFGEFGSMHHFISLMFDRDPEEALDDATVDEYVLSFGRTISKQLDRHNESSGLAARRVAT